MIITKTFTFDAAHHLPNVPDGHKCKRMHGHTYRVTVEIGGTVDPLLGWLIDYSEIAAVWQPIHDAIDHRLLNEIEGLANPTSEVLAPWLLAKFRAAGIDACAVELHESSTTMCRATVEDLS